jgi:hypothetical protein
MKIINPYFLKANINEIVFYIDGLSKSKNTEDEIKLSNKIDDFQEGHRFIGHYRVVLNKKHDYVYSIYDFDFMDYEKSKHQNHRTKSLEDMKIGDLIMIDSHLESITGTLLEKTEFNLKVLVNDKNTYQAPISSMYDITILK